MSHCKCTFCNLQLLNWAHRQRNTRMLLVSAIHWTDSSFLYRKPASKDHLSISCIGLPCTPAIQLKELCLENSNLKELNFSAFFPDSLAEKGLLHPEMVGKARELAMAVLSASTLASLCSLQQESHAKNCVQVANLGYAENTYLKMVVASLQLWILAPETRAWHLPHSGLSWHCVFHSDP